MKWPALKKTYYLKTCGCLTCASVTTLAFILVVSPLIFLFLVVGVARFPPQIFGTNSDHFKAHVISPIPESVDILDVEFDDILIHPDVAYYFRFSVNQDDLKKIIAHRSLKAANECSFAFSDPEWWDIKPANDVEMYSYDEDGFKLILCYHVPSSTAYYLYYTY